MKRGKRWDRSKYPPNFDDISLQKRKAHNFTCEFCGRSNEDKFESGGDVRVSFAHKYKNDEANPNPEGYCLCQSCHWHYDHPSDKIKEEGDHQVAMHRIANEQVGYVRDGRVWCDHEDCKGYYLPHTH
jgi:hypothetical protein